MWLGFAVIPGGQPGAAALETFPTQGAAGAYTWTVDIAAVRSSFFVWGGS